MFITKEDLENRLSRSGNNTKQDSSVLVEPILEDSIFPSNKQDISNSKQPAENQPETSDSSNLEVMEIPPAADCNMKSLDGMESLDVQVMPLDPLELDSLLDGEEVPDVLEVQEKRFRGRAPGSPNIPDFLRPIIGASLVLSGSKDTDEAFGLRSNKTAYLCRDGKTSNDGPVNQEHKDAVATIVNDATDKIKDAAVDKLMTALGCLTPEKIGKAKAGEISNVAKNMASIVNKITPKEKDVVNPTQIIIYAPAQKDLSQYDIVPSV